MTACTSGGTPPNKWQPLMRVSFAAYHTVNHVLGSSCAARGPLRCDDPLDLSGSGGMGMPEVQSDYVLSDIYVQVSDGTPTAWHTLRQYQLAYDQAAPPQITDPITGLQESVAGKLLLRQILVLGDDGATQLPKAIFTYGRHYEYYEDSLAYPIPTTNCGPAWNTGYSPNPSGCVLWSQSYEGNSYYLATVSNGLGLSQTFGWGASRDNMHRVTAGGDPADPWYCTNAQAGVPGYSGGSVYPCDMADDETWSRISLASETDDLVRLTQAGQGGTQTSTTVSGLTLYTYKDTYPLLAQECGDCAAGYSWGNQNDNDYLDFYNGKFMSFAQATVGNPDGSVDVHKFYSTEGWGLYDVLKVTCAAPNLCHNDPWWDLTNAAHGREYELDRYATNGTTLLQHVLTQYAAICTPPWILTGSPPVTGYGDWAGNLVAELDLGNPIAPCDVQTTQVDNKTFDGATGASLPNQTTTYTYETGTRPCPTCFGRVTKRTTTSNDGGANGSPTTIATRTDYIWNDNITTTSSSAAGTYLISFPALVDTEDAAGSNRYQCTYSGYDAGSSGATGQSSSLARGDLTRQDRYTSCGSSPNFTPSGAITTTYGFDNGVAPYGNPWWADDADANAGNTAHKGCPVNATNHSSCTSFDSYFSALPTQQANAFYGVWANAAWTTTYEVPASASAAGGWGLWPMSTTDVNSKATTNAYDALGRLTSQTLPNEGTGLTTLTMAYTVWCTGTSAQSPCAEIDRTQRLNSTTTVRYRAFYDGMGHLVETRSPSPSGDVVQYYYYDPSQRLIHESVPYFVTAYTGAAGSAAYSIPDSTQAGTDYAYDALGRATSVTDPLSHVSTTTYSVVCNGLGTGDSACYEQTAVVDPLGHKSAGLTDALGRNNYEQRYTGNTTVNYAVYATAKYRHDYPGDLTWILHPDGVTTTTFLYDMAGRKTGMTDPDRGSETYFYDQEGNPTQSVDARGASGTVYAGYDALNRLIWRNTTNSPTGAYDTYSYDSTAGGNVGKGRLTAETFSGAPNNSLSGGYAYDYDARGQQTTATLTVGSTSYPLGATYNDAGTVLTQTYPNGETVTNSYGAQGWLTGVSTSQGPTTLLSSAAYTGPGGANGSITSANLAGTTYQYSAIFDLLGRASDLKVKRSSDQVVLFDQTRTFDSAGNVSTANTALSAGTDNQSFCYDEQNRLTWAGSVGTPSCTGIPITAGTLTAAQYTQTLSYDTMGRLTSGPLGAYTYGNTAHTHAATSIGTAYTAAYDTAGDMTCRAPVSSITCSGTQTGAQLAYNSEGKLSNWQNQPTSPTSTAAFLYDGDGNRVVQQSTVSGSTTTTVYIGNVEEDATTGATTTKSAYYYANGQRIAMAVNGVFSYLASDGLGSANVVLNSSGSASASTLYAPYGSARYSSGTMPTDYGFTGQHADSITGLDYYGARYYDPTAGQFTNADTLLPSGGYNLSALSRYAYVEGNPINRTDPTGHHIECPDDPTCGGFYGSGGPTGHANGKPPGPPPPAYSPPTSNPPDTTTVPDAGVLAPDGAFITDSSNLPLPPNVVTASQAPPPQTIGDLQGDTSDFDFNDPNKAPGPGWKQQGPNWWNPNTDESLHPDLNNPKHGGPHWDYHRRGLNKKGRVQPNGQIVYVSELTAPSDKDVATGIAIAAGLLLIFVGGDLIRGDTTTWSPATCQRNSL